MSAYNDGVLAFDDGDSLSSNPYGGYDGEAWECGWKDAEWEEAGCPEEVVSKPNNKHEDEDDIVFTPEMEHDIEQMLDVSSL